MRTSGSIKLRRGKGFSLRGKGQVEEPNPAQQGLKPKHLAEV
jgi:hypothetical protein